MNRSNIMSFWRLGLMIIVSFMFTHTVTTAQTATHDESTSAVEKEAIYLMSLDEGPEWWGPENRFRWEKFITQGEENLPVVDRLLSSLIAKHDWLQAERAAGLLASLKIKSSYPFIANAIIAIMRVPDGVTNASLNQQKRCRAFVISLMDSVADPRVVDLCIKQIESTKDSSDRLVYISYLRKACVGDQEVASRLSNIASNPKSPAYNNTDLIKAVAQIKNAQRDRVNN